MKRYIKRYISSLVFFAALIALWEVLVDILQIKKYILPAPSQIGKALISTSSLLWEHSQQTIAEAGAGFTLAILIGVLLAISIELLPGIKKVVYPLLVLSQTIPIMAVAPLFIIWLGYGILPKIVIVTLVCFFPITVSLVEGLASSDQDMIRLLAAMGASRWQIFTKVSFPAALPSLFSGLKISAAYSVMGAVIGEWLGASRGLGVFMTRSMHSFLTERVFAVIVVISLLSMLLFFLIELGARLVMPWYYKRGE